MDSAQANEMWRGMLLGAMPNVRSMRRLHGALPSDPRCKMCKAPLAGPGSIVMRMMGRTRSSLNPTMCGYCLDNLAKMAPIGTGAEVELSMLFADVRGSTALAERMSPAEFSRTLARFHRAAGDVLVQHDALLDKLIGDQAIGLFLPGFAGADHARVAVRAGVELLRAMGHADAAGPWLPVGVGVHTGIAFVGVVGAHEGVRDITALGDAVNTTARLSSSAAAGEVLVSDVAYRAAGSEHPSTERRNLELKGRVERVDVHVLTVRHGAALPA